MEMENKLKDNVDESGIWKIPHIVERIFKNLEIGDLRRCACVCRLWKNISLEVRRRRDLELLFGMSNISYNEDLDELEALMTTIERPGTFFVQDLVEIIAQKMPKIDVEGVGTLIFPISREQAKQLIEQSVRAPFGRGQETILDLSVRKVWQLSPEKVHIVDSSWSGYLSNILFKVRAAFGCTSISAELYKLLVYDEGGFFKPHRDTEKAANMFGTLVVVLPSVHRGGELVIRHGKKQVRCDLSDSEKLAFTAFYADCKHEVLPVLEGNRVCLVYNLLQQTNARVNSQNGLVAPNYDREIEKTAEILKNTLMDPRKSKNPPKKIVWLLEHEYSQASVSFASLKNADSALARVFSEAAVIAKCDIYVAIVHLIEYIGDNFWEEDNSENEDIIKFDQDHDRYAQYLSNFVDTANKRVHFGKLAIEERELQPNGALYGDPPEDWMIGNEGASWELSYHRAALVIWDQNLRPLERKKRKLSKTDN